MSTIEIVSCHDPAEFPALARIWRRSVESTHGFLTHDDIAFYAPKVADSYLPAVTLRVARTGGRAVGFSGTDGNRLEMLFIDDNHRGRGIGGALLGEALDRIPRLELDVNEQNPDAVAFYRRHGFVTVGRSEIDADGRPFPLLHMVSCAAST
ncbi:GNAT family N-acetyltransferase [Williamsia soli]|uniref:GNAT family N-acetyltransferase n=1 Tax=Williamsia soli TaxID=364929 RepID=UPI0027DC08A2|nr:GNAT family N-acetyltransferase [Williamsia soli]